MTANAGAYGKKLGKSLVDKIFNLEKEVKDQKKTLIFALYEAAKIGVEYTQKIYTEDNV